MLLRQMAELDLEVEDVVMGNGGVDVYLCAEVEVYANCVSLCVCVCVCVGVWVWVCVCVCALHSTEFSQT